MQPTALRKTDPGDAPLHVVGQLGDIDRLLCDHVDGVVVERVVPDSIQSALNAMPLKQWMQDRCCLPANQVGIRIEQLFTKWGLSLHTAQRWVARDAEACAKEFARVLDTQDIHLRVEVIEDDACRKFHRDAIKARMICTYTGPGTEYTGTQTMDDPATIGTVPTGCPVLFKGKAWPVPQGQHLVHRSPPIEGLGISRLVLVIDEVLPPEGVAQL